MEVVRCLGFHDLLNDFQSVPIPHTNKYGIETIRYTGLKLWNSLPVEIKESRTLTAFKRKIKRHQFWNSNCGLCNRFVNNLGFFIDIVLNKKYVNRFNYLYLVFVF